ncbi:hypothetical protein [Kitasatospora aureofaciens]|uniref:hypothetical protein n=1 Tax=Kitasatospora aureofaciens TaxID=1894 RepID=UPI0037CA1EA8
MERRVVQDTIARALIDTGEHQRAARLPHERVTTRRPHVYEDLLLAPRSSTGPRAHADDR